MLNKMIFQSYWLIVGRICVIGEICVWGVIGMKAATVFVFSCCINVYIYILFDFIRFWMH